MNQGVTCVESLPCFRCWAEHCMYILPSHLYKNAERKVRLREVNYLLKAT